MQSERVCPACVRSVYRLVAGVVLLFVKSARRLAGNVGETAATVCVSISLSKTVQRMAFEHLRGGSGVDRKWVSAMHSPALARVTTSGTKRVLAVSRLTRYARD